MTTNDQVGRVVKPVDAALKEVSSARLNQRHAGDDFIDAVLAASSAGASQRMIGEFAGLSHARIGQIIRAYRIKY
jgi:hypothetical protein